MNTAKTYKNVKNYFCHCPVTLRLNLFITYFLNLNILTFDTSMHSAAWVWILDRLHSGLKNPSLIHLSVFWVYWVKCNTILLLRYQIVISYVKWYTEVYQVLLSCSSTMDRRRNQDCFAQNLWNFRLPFSCLDVDFKRIEIMYFKTSCHEDVFFSSQLHGRCTFLKILLGLIISKLTDFNYKVNLCYILLSQAKGY